MADNAIDPLAIDERLTGEDLLALSETPEVEDTDRYTDEELLRILGQELSDSLGGNVQDSELTQNWIDAMNYYLQRPRGDELPGRSHVISTDVADMVEQTLAQLMPAFSSPDLAEFEPQGEDDEEQACLESDAMNHIILDRNNGYMCFLQGVKDGMLQRAGIIKCHVQEVSKVKVETLRNAYPVQVLEALQPKSADEQSREVIAQTENGDGTFDIQIKTITTQRKLCLDPTPPEEFRINGDHNSPFLADARFCCHERPETQDDLIAMGYDPEVIDSLPTYTRKTYEQDRVRSRDEAELEYTDATRGSRSVLVQECYYQIDVDGDGIAERRKIVIGGGTSGEILENDYFPLVPFSGGTPFVLPHKFHGLSYYDKLKQTQDVKTAFLRKTIDNAEGLINQRVQAVAGQVHMGDLLASRPTGVVRVKQLNAIAPMPVQSMGDTGINMLNYMDKVRREAGGSALDAGTRENNPVANAGAHGLERFMTSQELLTGLIAKTFAETLIQGVYIISHQLLREFMPGELKFRARGNYQSTNPVQWVERERVAVNIGLSQSERQRRYQALGVILDQQLQAMQSGADDVLTDYRNIYRALIDQAKAAGLNAPEQYWINPESPEAMQALQGKAQSAQQNLEFQQQQAQQMAQLQVMLQGMQEETKRQGQMLDMQKERADYVQRWVEMELKHGADVPGHGIENGTVSQD